MYVSLLSPLHCLEKYTLMFLELKATTLMSGIKHFTRPLHWTEKCSDLKLFHKPKEIVKIKNELHLIFSSRPLMSILRDYIPAGIITLLDIFDDIPFSPEDVYRLLYHISNIDTPRAAILRRVIFEKVVDEKGRSLTTSMLGERAGDSIRLKYHFSINTNSFWNVGVTSFDTTGPLGKLHEEEMTTILEREEIKERLMSRYDVSNLDWKEVWYVGMRMRHCDYRWNAISRVSHLIIFIIFMDPEDVSVHFDSLTLFQHEDKEDTDVVMMERCLDMEMGMAREFHKSGLLMLDAARLLRELASVGDAKFATLGENYVKRRLWMPMRYMLRWNTRVVEDREFSCVVEYEGVLGQRRRYTVGIADGWRTRLLHGSYTQPLYEFVSPNGGSSRVFYEQMLLSAALRFTPFSGDSHCAIQRVGELYKEHFGSWEVGKDIFSGEGSTDLIRDFIIHNENFLTVDDS